MQTRPNSLGLQGRLSVPWKSCSEATLPLLRPQKTCICGAGQSRVNILGSYNTLKLLSWGYWRHLGTSGKVSKCVLTNLQHPLLSPTLCWNSWPLPNMLHGGSQGSRSLLFPGNLQVLNPETNLRELPSLSSAHTAHTVELRLYPTKIVVNGYNVFISVLVVPLVRLLEVMDQVI